LFFLQIQFSLSCWRWLYLFMCCWSRNWSSYRIRIFGGNQNKLDQFTHKSWYFPISLK
jgi:hypothetical protein